MSKLAVFLGAGASFEVGLPLVWELTSTIRKNIIKRIDTNLFNFRNNDTIKAQFIQLILNPDLHYEQVIGELENQVLNENKRDSIWRGLAMQMVEVVHLLLLEEHRNTISMMRRKFENYGGIKELANCGSVDFFSLNHDVVIEELCSFYGVEFRDGFHSDSHEYQHIGKFKILKKEQIKNGEYNFLNSEESGINLIKLHGALDVFCANDKDLFLKVCSQSERGRVLESLLALEKYSFRIAKNQFRAVNELTVKDDKGELQFFRRSLLSGAHKFSDRIEQIIPISFLHLFEQRLALTNKIVIIGYSFGDEHINLILEDWTNRIDAKVEILDPFRSDVPACFERNSRKVTITPAGLTDFFVKYGGSLNNDGEVIALQIAKSRNRLKEARLAD